MKIKDIPKFTINSKIINQLFRLEKLRDSCKGIDNKKAEIELRKTSMIRSVNSSLAIKGNNLGLLKVHDIIYGKTMEGPFNKILEVKNAIKAYDSAQFVNPWDVQCFLEIYDDAMWGLVEEYGFRTHKIDIYKEKKLVYLAPPAEEIREMMERLFDWCESSDFSPTVTAAVAHFYIESIHPFPDGNGRMGRMWHFAILHQYDPIFDLIPIESRIHRHQKEYYETLERCQHMNVQDCTGFIEFCLDMNIESLTNLLHLKDPNISRLLDTIGAKPMSATQIMKKMGLSSKQHFLRNYMRPAIEYGFVSMTEPNSPHSCRQKYRKNRI